MIRRSTFFPALLLVTAGALLFRLPDLGNRPMHGDEAVHASKFYELWQKGTYHYDSNEFHGPTLYYAALPSAWLHGRTDFASLQESDLRLPIALFGAGMALLLVLLAGAMPRPALLVAAVLTAISPAFVFYSRYYIQETLLAFFTPAALGCAWRYTQRPTILWAAATGLCAVLMVATKETAVLSFVAMGVGLGAAAVWTRLVDGRSLALRRFWKEEHVLLATGVGLFTACLFLTGFFTNLSAPLDYLRSYTTWTQRAHGTDLHQHPWHYYLSMLVWTHRAKGPVWSEGLIVGLALVGIVTALRRRRNPEGETRPGFARFLAFYTLTLIAVYTAIPYKTPWCVLSFLSGLILLAGIGAAALICALPGRPLKGLAGLLLLVGAAQLAWQAYGTSYLYYVDRRNPYVYAQTVPDIEQLQERVEEVSLVHPDRDRMVIKVFSVDEYYWPVPWYLRRFPNIGYWIGLPEDVQETTAPVVIASPEFDEELTRRLDPTHIMTGFIGLRPGGVTLMVWVDFELWKKHVEKKNANRKPEPESE